MVVDNNEEVAPRETSWLKLILSTWYIKQTSLRFHKVSELWTSRLLVIKWLQREEWSRINVLLLQRTQLKKWYWMEDINIVDCV